jgi:hypothetical protein
MIKAENIKLITEQDFSELVSKTYNRRYDFQQQDGCKDRGTEHITVPTKNPFDYKNDSIPEVVNGNKMGVSFKAWLARDPKKELPGEDDKDDFSLELFWERNFYPSVDMVINDLYEKGLLEAGEYIIDIDW